MSSFKQERILTSIDLDNNKIATLGSEPINIRTESLSLEFNQISSIEEHTFNNSEIGILSLNENRQLTHIHPNAFANLKNLIKLDLSRTSVRQLPAAGLQQLRTLIIRDTYALKRIPSIYVFPVLERAHLTYAYHCCAFRYPKSHDPSAYEDHLRLQEKLNAICSSRRASESVGSSSQGSTSGSSETQSSIAQLADPSVSSTASSDFEGIFLEDEHHSPADAIQRPPMGGGPTSGGSASELNVGLDLGYTSASSAPGPRVAIPNGTGSRTPLEHNGPLAMLIPKAIISATDPALGPSVGDQPKRPPLEHGSSSTTDDDLKQLWLMKNIECGELAVAHNNSRNISCIPEPDAFNPCEDIMGYSILRVAVWLVVGCSVFGNLSVIVVLMAVLRRLSVPKFLQLNLAIGDLFMGVYLTLLALADLTTAGSYFNYAIDWQHGFGCKLTGAASLFASQLSIYTLSVITFERYYTITYSIDLNMRLQLGWAARIMLFGWLYAFASAMLPIFADVNSYSKTSICIPMRTTYLTDRIFIFVLLLIDSSAFVIIFACYLRMYLLILRQKTEATTKERTVAMRMALLVFTDFACWAPIIFFGVTAFFGQPLISVTNSKILLVFFYPLNSMANPFLYVISTRQYRRDLNYLSIRWQMWRENLFRRNTDSFASFNNPNTNYGMMVTQHPYNQNATAAHLGAIAAVTGVAVHQVHRKCPKCQRPRSDNNNEDVANAAGCDDLQCGNQQQNGHQQDRCKFLCTRANLYHGKFIIRHQIIPDKYALSSGRDMMGARRLPKTQARIGRSDDPPIAMTSANKAILRQRLSSNQGPSRGLTNASKIVNWSVNNGIGESDLERDHKTGSAIVEAELGDIDRARAQQAVNESSKSDNSVQSAAQKTGSGARTYRKSSQICSDSSTECCQRCCRCCFRGPSGGWSSNSQSTGSNSHTSGHNSVGRESRRAMPSRSSGLSTTMTLASQSSGPKQRADGARQVTIDDRKSSSSDEKVDRPGLETEHQGPARQTRAKPVKKESQCLICAKLMKSNHKNRPKSACDAGRTTSGTGSEVASDHGTGSCNFDELSWVSAGEPSSGPMSLPSELDQLDDCCSRCLKKNCRDVGRKSGAHDGNDANQRASCHQDRCHHHQHHHRHRNRDRRHRHHHHGHRRCGRCNRVHERQKRQPEAGKHRTADQIDNGADASIHDGDCRPGDDHCSPSSMIKHQCSHQINKKRDRPTVLKEDTNVPPVLKQSSVEDRSGNVIRVTEQSSSNQDDSVVDETGQPSRPVSEVDVKEARTGTLKVPTKRTCQTKKRVLIVSDHHSG